MKCIKCKKEFKDLLRHVHHSENCQSSYDMEKMIQNRKLERIEKKKVYMRQTYGEQQEKILLSRKKHYANNRIKMIEEKKEYYEENKSKILEERKEYYEENKSKILEERKEYYEKNKSKILGDRKEYYEDKREIIRAQQKSYYRNSRAKVSQKRRFNKYFWNMTPHRNPMSYVTPEQEHLYKHSQGYCQAETMANLNHAIEFDDGVCDNCQESKAVKIIDVNRIVCLGCMNAYCFICKLQVSSDPFKGYLHYYTAETKSLLGPTPGFCSLYTTSSLPATCKICKELWEKFPEYELFLEPRKKYSDGKSYETDFYVCNLCKTIKEYVCQFDLHLRNHTKFGQQVAIISLKVEIEKERLVINDDVSDSVFCLIENEIVKATGVVAVLSVFRTELFKFGTKFTVSESMNLGTALLLYPGTDIDKEISELLSNNEIIKQYEILYIGKHFRETYTNVDVLAADDYNDYYENIDCKYEYLFLGRPGCGLSRLLDRMRKRNIVLIEERCALTYPDCDYKSNIKNEDLFVADWLAYRSALTEELFASLWKLVKQSELCCCVSEFYCTTSTNTEKCEEGCCGKCESSVDEDAENTSESDTLSETDTPSSSSSSSEAEESDDYKYLSS